MKSSRLLEAVLFIVMSIEIVLSAVNNEALETCQDEKCFKNMLKTKPNLLILFSKSDNDVKDVYKLLKEVNLAVKGIASVAYINCE